MFKIHTIVIIISLSFFSKIKSVKNKNINYDADKKIFITKNEKNIALNKENMIVQNNIDNLKNKKVYKKKRVTVVPKNKIQPDLEVANFQPFKIEKKNGQIKFNYLII